MRMRILFLIQVIFLSGCISLLQDKPETTDAEIHQWLDNKDYSRAIDALELKKQRIKSTEYREWLEEARAEAWAYDQLQSEAILKLLDKGEWLTASTMLQQGLRSYPDGPELNRMKSRVEPERLKHLRRMEAQLLLARADWLLRSSHLQQAIAQIDPNNPDIQKQNSKTQKDMSITARKLYEFGAHALDVPDIETADSCLTMSDRLYPMSHTSSALARLDQLRYQEKQIREQQQKLAEEQRIREEQQRRERQQAQQQQQQQRAFKQQLIQARKQLQSGELVNTRVLLKKLADLSPDNAEYLALRKDYEKIVSRRIEEQLSQGSQLYINGKIAEAREIWLQALELDPENTRIREHIARADRVLGRLNELKSQESAPQENKTP